MTEQSKPPYRQCPSLSRHRIPGSVFPLNCHLPAGHSGYHSAYDYQTNNTAWSLWADANDNPSESPLSTDSAPKVCWYCSQRLDLPNPECAKSHLHDSASPQPPPSAQERDQ